VSPVGWQPNTVVTRQLVDSAPVRALGALLDSGAAVPQPGDPLPPLWHWVALPRWVASSQVSSDGHPPRGALLPAVDLPRRMFAGGSVNGQAPLIVGETVERTERAVSVAHKTGRSGSFVVVTVETSLHAEDGTLRLEERQDLVFRGTDALRVPGAPPSPEVAAGLTPQGPPLRRTSEGGWAVATDPTLLMRFSAATANAHRIHYDWPYATGVEGYPGLVVHGPLSTLLLAETVRLDRGTPASFRYTHRHLAPVFCGEPCSVTSTAEPGSQTQTRLLVGPDGTPRGRLVVHHLSSAPGDSRTLTHSSSKDASRDRSPA
jgi:3-methylfumaryl-CoA hydratase